MVGRINVDRPELAQEMDLATQIFLTQIFVIDIPGSTQLSGLPLKVQWEVAILFWWEDAKDVEKLGERSGLAVLSWLSHGPVSRAVQIVVACGNSCLVTSSQASAGAEVRQSASTAAAAAAAGSANISSPDPHSYRCRHVRLQLFRSQLLNRSAFFDRSSLIIRKFVALNTENLSRNVGTMRQLL